MTDAEFTQLLTDEQAHPIALMREMIRRYDLDWMGWMISVTRRTLKVDLGVDIARVNLQKVMAAAAVATRDEFWDDWEHFHFLAQALNNNIPDAQIHKELTLGQLMTAVDIARAIRKELGSLSFQPKFNEEVSRYVAAQALNDGVWYLPEPLAFAQRYAAGKRYRCRDCGNDAEVVFEDGLCDHCVDRYDTSSLSTWEPDPELLAKGWGKNIEVYERNPTAKVAKRYAQVLMSSRGPVLQENETDICVARLLVAQEYMGERRRQLEEQT